jgi:hypothetical protein
VYKSGKLSNEYYLLISRVPLLLLPEDIGTSTCDIFEVGTSDGNNLEVGLLCKADFPSG